MIIRKLCKQIEIEKEFNDQLQKEKGKLDLLIKKLIKEKEILHNSYESSKIENNSISSLDPTSSLKKKTSYIIQVNSNILCI